jgi:hypothetical protein
MGESDRIEQLLAQARNRLRAESGRVAGHPPIMAYVAPASPSDPLYQATYSGGQQLGADESPKRYAGRSQRTAVPALGGSGSSTVHNPPSTVQTGPEQPVSFGGRLVRPLSVPWSFRLILAVSILSSVLVAWRVTGLFSAVDAPTGVESTHAAFVNILIGQTVTPATIRFLPPQSPWYGAAPDLPSSGLPVYGWLTAAVMLLFGSVAWAGRLVSVVASLLAGLALFAVVRRTAGARSALYALLLYSVAPLSVVLGQQFSPSALILAAQALTLLALVRWRALADARAVGNSRATGARLSFVVALISASFLGLVDPGAIFIALPAAYITIAPGVANDTPVLNGGPLSKWGEAWARSRYRGHAAGIISALMGPSLLWWAFNQGSAGALWLGVGDGGGGIAAVLSALLNGGTYMQVVGLLVERVLTVVGLLLLAAGLLNGARPPLQSIFHAWLAGGLLHILLDASRLPSHSEVLLPLIMPACALAGIGAAWAGALPARIWLAMGEQKRDREYDFAVSPHTAWLLDLPEERVYVQKAARPQAQLALSRSLAQRSRTELLRLHGAWLLALGHVIIFAVLALIVAGGMPTLFAALQPTTQATEVAAIGTDVGRLVPKDARIIVVGPFAPEIFYSSQRTGWALAPDDFNIARVAELQRDGAAFLVSADQDWLGRQPDYRGLITSYSVLKLTRDYILFDLSSKPSDTDRLYFLESGHTLGGAFRAFWERNGGVTKLGYPISEELVEKNPLDGQTRTVQYFERAVLEYHEEKAGTSDAVMLASVGLWVTQGRDFPRVAPFSNTADKWYFPQTGHMVKEAFLRYWQQQGGVALFGYPISEELPEINPGDGKVYTVQYFERARLEWHPTFAGTPDEVQLGLIGKQALEMPTK